MIIVRRGKFSYLFMTSRSLSGHNALRRPPGQTNYTLAVNKYAVEVVAPPIFL